ncbi:MAG: hypothetical protein IJJ31_06090 [Mogibacterium sp.]|nr:hypothetical protein [Mogibacterium sp.]
MISFLKKNWIIFAVFILIVAVSAGFSIYRSSVTSLLSKSEYTELYDTIKDNAESGAYSTQASLSSYITRWADNAGVSYEKDAYGNIIFAREASGRKKNLPPVLICVSYNYETVKENANLIAGAAMIAKSDIASGSRTVIFFNDEQNNGTGYQSIDSSYLTGDQKIIYLDYGSSSYISTSSFGKEYSSVRIKAGRYEPECDSAVRVRISGITSGVIGTGISKHPDPVSALSTLFTRLKSKSVSFQLADFKVGQNGSMYPVSAEATIMLNSYALPSFTKYIDKRIKAWEKAYGKDYEDLSYTYEVIDDPEKLPTESYSRKATARLTNSLYTIQSGIYKYEEGDNIPEGRAAGDVCGINAITGMHAEDGYICIDLMTQAYSDDYMDRIMGDNTAAAELFDGTLKKTSSISRFLNSKDSLRRTMISTYYKVNNSSAGGGSLKSDTDNYFTPCSYIAERNPKADIIHLRFNSDNASAMINTLLCYIAFRGNNFIL